MQLPLFDVVEAPRAAQRRRPSDFVEEIERFTGFGARSRVLTDTGILYIANEFWTSAQRQAHALHEISYRACFKPQLPEFFIERLTAPGDVVYDPFMGRGTTPLQAALMGRRAAGNDINPLSLLLIRPRFNPPTLAEVARRLAEVPWDTDEAREEDLLTFFSPTTLHQILALRGWLARRAPLDTMPRPVDDWIRMVALNRLTGHSPGFFSVYTMPPNQAVSIAAQRKINERRKQTPPNRNIRELILRKTKSLLVDGTPPAGPAPTLLAGLAQNTPSLADASVDLVVTSPPFLDVVQYADDNWLRCWFAGVDPANVALDIHRETADWQAMVRATLYELARVVRPGGYVAFEVGEVRGGKVLLERLVWSAAEGLPFERLAVMVNEQEFTKTANCWGVTNNRRGTNSNRIVLLRRSKGS